MRLYNAPAGLLVERDGRWVRLSETSWDAVVNRDDLHDWLSGEITRGAALSTPPDLTRLRPPIGSQEVWAAGVTYFRSRTARMEEAKSAGGGDFYDRVYEAERPELFFKATPHRVRGHGAGRPDSPRREMERARARACARRDAERDDRRLHDRQRHELARHRRREPALPAPGQGVRRQLRAGTGRAGDRRTRCRRRPRFVLRFGAAARTCSLARRRWRR